MHYKVILSPELAKVQKEGISPRIIKRALNRTGKGARAFVSREVRQIYNIKKKDFDKHLKFVPAKQSTTAALHIKAKRLNVYYFSAPSTRRQFLVNPAGWVVRGGRKVRKPYVKVKIKKQEGWKWLPHFFVAKMDSGHTGVFRRLPNWRHKWVEKKQRYHGLPIAEVTTVSPVQMIENRQIMRKLDSYVSERLTKELIHEIRYQLGVK